MTGTLCDALKAGSIRAGSSLPAVSIYTQLVANTLSFYLFALRIKQPHRATGSVSHCRHRCEPASPIHTANNGTAGYVTTSVYGLNSRDMFYTGTPLIWLSGLFFLTHWRG